MPLPNPKVAKALIESYINIRKDTWGMDPQNPGKALNQTGKEKIKVCLEYLENIDQAKTLTQWIDLIYDISAKATEIHTKSANRRSGLTGAIIGLFSSEGLLLDMLLAVRSYLLHELRSVANKDDKVFDQFSQVIKQLIEQSNQVQTQKSTNTIDAIEKLAYLGDFSAITQRATVATTSDNTADTAYSVPSYLMLDWHIKFFNEQIKKHDTEAARLGEKTFDDFQNNVTQGARTLVITQRLSESSKAAPTAQEVSPVEPEALVADKPVADSKLAEQDEIHIDMPSDDPKQEHEPVSRPSESSVSKETKVAEAYPVTSNPSVIFSARGGSAVGAKKTRLPAQDARNPYNTRSSKHKIN